MARRSFRSSIRPVNRIKHVVDLSGTVAANAVGTWSVATSVDTPVLADIDGVETGSTVNGVYVRFEAASNEAISAGAIPNFYFMLVKNPGGNVTFPKANLVGSNDNKRFVIHQEMTMLENKGQGSNARTVFNGVIVIPKGYRRMAPNDTLTILTVCPAIDTVQCLQAIYKEFR